MQQNNILQDTNVVIQVTFSYMQLLLVTHLYVGSNLTVTFNRLTNFNLIVFI